MIFVIFILFFASVYIFKYFFIININIFRLINIIYFCLISNLIIFIIYYIYFFLNLVLFFIHYICFIIILILTYTSFNSLYIQVNTYCCNIIHYFIVLILMNNKYINSSIFTYFHKRPASFTIF